MRHRRWIHGTIRITLLVLVALLLAQCRQSTSPTPPTVDTPTVALRVGDVALSGNAPPDSIVDIALGDQFAGRARADASGAWSLTVSIDEPGTITVTVRTVDGDGNELARAAPLPLDIAPALAALDAGAPELTSPVVGLDYRVAAQLVWSGAGEPGATVVVRNDGVALGSTTVLEDGTWSFTGPLELPPGAYALSAEMVVDGAVEDASAEIPFDVPDLSAQLPPLTISAEFRNGAADISGTTGPNSLVDILRDGETVAQVTANGSGVWSYRTTALNGPAEYGARYPLALVGDGPLAEPVTVSVGPPGVLPPPTIDVALTSDGAVIVSGSAAAGAPLAVTISDTAQTTTAGDDGMWMLADPVVFSGTTTARIRYSDAKSTPSSVAVRFASQDPAAQGDLNLALVARRTDDLLLSGRAAADAAVDLRVNGALVDTVRAGDDGIWRWRSAAPPADYLVEAQSGDASARAQITLDGDLGLAVTWEPSTVRAPRVELAGFMPTPAGLVPLAGDAPPLSTLTLWVNGAALDAIPVGPDGTFSTSVALPGGVYTLTVSLPVAESGADRRSDPLVLAVPSTADEVIVEAVTLAESPDPRTMGGSAAPQSELVLYVDGNETESVSADAQGNWQVTLPATPAGAHVWAQYATAPVSPTPITIQETQLGRLQLAFVNESTGGSELTVTTTVPATHLIFDASWSMSEPLGDSTRAQVARDALLAIVTRALPQGAPVGLRAFGNIEGNYVCRTDLMLPPGPLNRAEATAVIAALEPQFNANTAIAASLAAAPADLASVDGPTRLVLLTDGGETCGGDPASAIQALTDAGLEITVDVVGFAIDDPALAETFAQWAALGGGRYYDADSADALVASLAAAVGIRYEITDAGGGVVGSGLVGGPPVELPVGAYTVTLLTDEPVAVGEVVVSADATTLVWVEQE